MDAQKREPFHRILSTGQDRIPHQRITAHSHTRTIKKKYHGKIQKVVDPVTVSSLHRSPSFLSRLDFQQ